MYRIIGADKNEYGPVPAEQLRQWIAEGRVNGQTMVCAEGTSEWKPLSQFPELAGTMPPPAQTAAPAPMAPLPAPGIAPGPMPGYFAPAADQVSAPAIGLIVTAIIGILYQVGNMAFSLVWSPGKMNFGGNSDQIPAWITAMSGTVGLIFGIIGILAGVLILYGGLQMKKLENYGLAMTASIVAMIPCISPCCLVGLPIGIWALIVLNKPEIKGAFH